MSSKQKTEQHPKKPKQATKEFDITIPLPTQGEELDKLLYMKSRFPAIPDSSDES